MKDFSKDKDTILKYILSKNLIGGSNKIKLTDIQKELKIKYGNFDIEVDEQLMNVEYIKPNDKVLEIGGNIGRNSLVIASILNDSTNLVVLECDKKFSEKCIENRNINNFKFHVENSALSKNFLIQRNMNDPLAEGVIKSESVPEGYNRVNIISWDELNKKYKIKFNVLVLDCEGAFYDILNDFPEILQNIRLILVENDYNSRDNYEFVKKILITNYFKNVYTKAYGDRNRACHDVFYEVWLR